MSNTVLTDTLKSMEANELVEKKIIVQGNKSIPEYYLTDKGLKLNRI